MSIITAADVFAHRLPVPIQRIQGRFSRCPDLWDMRGNWLKLINILVSYTPLGNLEAPLVFNSKNPASLIGVTERTIGRYLDALVQNGLIVRIRQGRFNDGQWGCTSVRWSSSALEKYFYPHTKKADYKAPEKDFGIDLNRRTKMSDKSEDFKNKVILKKSPDGEASMTGEQDRGKGRQQSIPGIPKDLVEPSLALGLTRELVVTLMGKCKKRGIRLQDVIFFHLPVIKERGLKGKEAFAWLLRAIASGRDFAWAVKARKQDNAKATKSPKRMAFIARVAATLAVQRVRLPSGAWLSGSTEGHQAEIRSVAHGKVEARYICLTMLATHLVKNSPFWVKSLLRGRIQPESPTMEMESGYTTGAGRSESQGIETPPSIEAFRSRLQGFVESFSYS